MGSTKTVPRTRGDQPTALIFLHLLGNRSPHTRGSTGLADLDRAMDNPFPAHAGINRDSPGRTGATKTVPRTRGDQPSPYDATEPVFSRSPHTRGSTEPPKQQKQ